MSLPYRFVIALDIEEDSLEQAYETLYNKLHSVCLTWDDTEEWLDQEDESIPAERIEEVLANFYAQLEEKESCSVLQEESISALTSPIASDLIA